MQVASSAAMLVSIKNLRRQDRTHAASRNSSMDRGPPLSRHSVDLVDVRDYDNKESFAVLTLSGITTRQSYNSTDCRPSKSLPLPGRS